MVTFTRSYAEEIRDGVVRATKEGFVRTGVGERWDIVRAVRDSILKVACAEVLSNKGG